MPSPSDHLLQETRFLDKLYDADSMMLIPSSVASGFVVLLGGDRHNNPNPILNADLSLAFLSLTQGNVLDACFGVVNPSAVRRGPATPASQSAREGKAMLDECAQTTSTESFQRAAVSAYCDAFQLVIIHCDQMNRLNCITRCFLSRRIRKKTERNLQEAFMGLAKAIAETPTAHSY